MFEAKQVNWVDEDQKPLKVEGGGGGSQQRRLLKVKGSVSCVDERSSTTLQGSAD
jgi:hypothetical protein